MYGPSASSAHASMFSQVRRDVFVRQIVEEGCLPTPKMLAAARQEEVVARSPSSRRSPPRRAPRTAPPARRGSGGSRPPQNRESGLARQVEAARRTTRRRRTRRRGHAQEESAAQRRHERRTRRAARGRVSPSTGNLAELGALQPHGDGRGAHRVELAVLDQRHRRRSPSSQMSSIHGTIPATRALQAVSNVQRDAGSCRYPSACAIMESCSDCNVAENCVKRARARWRQVTTAPWANTSGEWRVHTSRTAPSSNWTPRNGTCPQGI